MSKNYRVTESNGLTRDCIINEAYNITCTNGENQVRDVKVDVLTSNKDIVIKKLIEDLVETTNKMHCYKEIIYALIQKNLLPQEIQNIILASFNEVSISSDDNKKKINYILENGWVY